MKEIITFILAVIPVFSPLKTMALFYTRIWISSFPLCWKKIRSASLTPMRETVFLHLLSKVSYSLKLGNFKLFKFSYPKLSKFELRRQDLNLRPPDYDSGELPDCSTPRYEVLGDQPHIFLLTFALMTAVGLEPNISSLKD